MDPEYLDSQLQSLQETHSTIRNLPEEFVASLQQQVKAALAVNKRCLQLIADLEEARRDQEELLAEQQAFDEQYVDRS